MIKNEYIVEKRNILNELRCNNMHLQELRFFTIYLAKIDSRRPEETRKVEFRLSDFLAIMEIDKVNIVGLKHTTNSLLCKVVNIPDETGGYIGFQLFKECRVYKGHCGDWFVEIDAHNRALPLMFEFKEQYFTYQLWNALRLNSVNQLRMYEILKQYEWRGQRIISIRELKELLSVSENEYKRFDNFKTKVLDSCKRALKENTDICYDYELIKKGRGGKVVEIKFKITKNIGHNDQLSLDEFICRKEIKNSIDGPEITAVVEATQADDDEDSYFKKEMYPLLTDACKNEFNLSEIQVLYNLIIQIIPYRSSGGSIADYQLEAFNYLKRRYDELIWQAGRTSVKSRFGYLKKMIESDLPTVGNT